MNKAILYHHPCADGMTAAYVAWKKFGSEAMYYPMSYGDKIPDIKNKTVYLLDFSFKREQMLEAAAIADKVIVLDHHQSAEEELAPLLKDGTIDGEFDMVRSGAGMTWDYFFQGQPRPEIVNYVEDRDLWLYKLHMSMEVGFAVFSYAYSFENWEKLFNEEIGALATEGAPILRKHLKDCEELLENASKMRIGGYTVPAINVNYTYGSDVANMLSRGHPFAAYYWMNKNMDYVFGLRSQPDGADVAKIAQLFGGGGHKHASGFRVRSIIPFL